MEAERSVDRLAILDHGRVIVEGSPAQLKERIADDLRLELVLEPGAVPPVPAPFVLHTVATGARILATVPATAAAEAVGWADSLKRTGQVEEFALAPATLEDVYVELVGRADALQNGTGGHAGAPSDGPADAGRSTKEAARVGAA